MRETKIKINQIDYDFEEHGGGAKSVELLSITTAPQPPFPAESRYYNSDENVIYKAIVDNTWENAETFNPEVGVLYTYDNETYLYDGKLNSLFKIGDSTSSSELFIVNKTLPVNTVILDTEIDFSENFLINVYVNGLLQTRDEHYYVENTNIVFTSPYPDEMNVIILYTNSSSVSLRPGNPSETTNYNSLTNKPQINGVTLSGNKTSSELGIDSVSEDQVIIKSSNIPEASEENVGKMYIYDGEDDGEFTHGHIYECKDLNYNYDYRYIGFEDDVIFVDVNDFIELINTQAYPEPLMNANNGTVRRTSFIPPGESETIHEWDFNLYDNYTWVGRMIFTQDELEEYGFEFDNDYIEDGIDYLFNCFLLEINIKGRIDFNDSGIYVGNRDFVRFAYNYIRNTEILLDINHGTMTYNVSTDEGRPIYIWRLVFLDDNDNEIEQIILQQSELEDYGFEFYEEFENDDVINFTCEFEESDEEETIYEWQNISRSLPDQEDQEGKYLTTDGYDAYWESIDYNNIENTPELSNVAISGNYNDLIDKPELSNVAISGSYLDLTNTPVIPTVNNSTVTINQDGQLKGYFTLNQENNIIINLDNGNTIYDSTITINQGGQYKGSFTLNQNNNVVINLDGGSVPVATIDYFEGNIGTSIDTQLELGNTVLVFKNGQLMQSGNGNDYTINNSNIVFTTPLESVDKVAVINGNLNVADLSNYMLKPRVITDGNNANLIIAANTIYKFTNTLTTLTISNVEVSDYESRIYFTTGNSINFTDNSNLRWGGDGSAPATLNTNTVYCIAICNGLAEINTYGTVGI